MACSAEGTSGLGCAERKSPQSAEKRKPSALSPDAEAYVPRNAREGSSKPEEAAQPAATGTHRHHKRARTEVSIAAQCNPGMAWRMNC